MQEVEKSRGNPVKRLYKMELRLLKVLPVLLAVLYFSNTLCDVFNKDFPILSCLGGLSFIPFIFILISSFVFKFCTYHRMFLYYCVVNDTINWIDYAFKLDINDIRFLAIHLIVAFVFLLLILYLRKYENYCNKTTSETDK